MEVKPEDWNFEVLYNLSVIFPEYISTLFKKKFQPKQENLLLS